MSKTNDKYDKVRLYPETKKALKDYRKAFAIPPALTATVNQATLIGLKQLSK